MEITKVMRLPKFLMVLVVAGAVSSCGYAKKDDLDALRTEVMANKRMSEQALSTANDAQAAAQRAEMTAKKAEETVNRSYKAGMRK